MRYIYLFLVEHRLFYSKMCPFMLQEIFCCLAVKQKDFPHYPLDASSCSPHGPTENISI